MSSTILGTALPAFIAHADPTTLYVNNDSAVNCSDAGAGTPAQPFCTVQAAADVVQAGQTVVITPNASYPEQVTVKHSGTPGNPITFKGAGDRDAEHSTARIGVDSNSPDASSLPHAFVFNSGVHDVVVSGLSLVAPQEAVLITDADHIVVNGSYFKGVGSGTPGAPAIRLTGKTTNTTISRNFILPSGAAGVAVDAGVAGTVVTTNMISADHGPAVSVTDAPGTVVTSNTVDAHCEGGITLAGASANSTIENNVIDKSSCPSQPDLSVSADSAGGTKVDYNVLQAPAPGGVSYEWGTGTAASQPEFTQISGGQGTHDLMSAGPVDRYPIRASEATDSADANAPGELATDYYDNPRVDDPQVPNTGTGVGYYDRGAIEFQDNLVLSVEANPAPQPGRPLNAVIYVSRRYGGWGTVTGTVDFGDGTRSRRSGTTSPGWSTRTPNQVPTPSRSLGRTAPLSGQ